MKEVGSDAGSLFIFKRPHMNNLQWLVATKRRRLGKGAGSLPNKKKINKKDVKKYDPDVAS